MCVCVCVYVCVQKLRNLIMFWYSSHLVETQLLPSSGRINTAIWMHHLDANKMVGEEARRQLHKNVASNIKRVQAATPHKAPTIRPPASHHEK